MKVSDLKLAREEMRTFIISQAEHRLAGQMQFATAADQRSATMSGAATALATLSFGIAAQAAASGKNEALTLGALVLSLGFTLAAWFALQSAKCQDFHPSGYYPENFLGDVKQRKRMQHIQAEIAEDLNERLRFNSNILTQRGRQIEASVNTMFATPLIGGAAFLLINYLPTWGPPITGLVGR